MPFAGLLNLPAWGYVVAALLVTHVTIASVTIFLHRHQAHRALSLHPVASHFFRAWLWLTTGMSTREWVAVHRKHHAKCETEEDPHSPQTAGIWKVLFGGVALYRREACNQETLKIYGRGTPDDWLERRVYRFPFLGLGLMLLLDLLLFGLAGLAVFAVQMLWIPFWAAGVINGVGHYWGYRNFETQDASRNIVPFGILIGGEELHNNHHAYQYSARLSNKWWEFDIGWMYIRLLELAGLASVKRTAPKTVFEADGQIDMETLRAVIGSRFHILKLYGSRVIVPVFRRQQAAVSGFASTQLRRIRRVMTRDDTVCVDPTARQWLEIVLADDQTLRTVYQFKQRLNELWAQSSADGDRLRRLQDWCAEAEASGIRALRDFARQLQGYRQYQMA